MDNSFKNSFVMYRSFTDAIRKFYELGVITGENVAKLLFAINDLALDGKETALEAIEDAVFTQIRPQIEANRLKAIGGEKGGRPQKALPSIAELEAMRNELGSIEAVADELGVDKTTIYRHINKERECCKTVAKPLQNSPAVAKPNEELGIMNVNENEREGAQVPPAPPQSFGSVEFPVERAKYLPPPTLDEVKAHCEEQGYSFNPETFLAYYNATGWKKKNGCKITDWRAEAAVWENREHKDDKARASPVYQTWVAPSEPALDEEERIEMTEFLGGMVSKIKAKVALGGV